MELSAATRVGMLTVVAFILLGLVFLEIGKVGPEAGTTYHIIFDDVQGIQVRSAVRLSGVRIGYVSDIQLNSQNKVDMSIQVTRPNVKLYSSDYFVYTIASSILGDKWLDIKPGVVPEGIDPISPDEMLMGTTPISLEELAKEGSDIMNELRSSISALNEIIGDDTFKRDIKDTVGNVKEISDNLKGASSDARLLMEEVRQRVNKIASTMEQVADNTSATVAQLRSDAKEIGSHLRSTTSTVNGLVQGNASNINEIVSNLRAMSESLKNTASVVENLSNDPAMREDVLAIVSNIRRVSEEVAGIAGDVRNITKDPEVQDDIKATVHNVREASGSANRIVNRFEKTVEKIPGGGGLRSLVEGDVSEEWKMKDGKLSTNASVTLFPNGGPVTLKLGLDSIGNENLLNLQAGKTWDKFRVRGGIVRSKVGVGADAWMFDKRLETSVDIYDPRDIKVDVLGKVILPHDWYVYGGVRDLTDKHHSSAVVGAGKRF